MIVDGVNIEILTLEALEGIKFALWYVVLALISLCGITISKR